MKLDLSWLLRPGVSDQKGMEGRFWQRFVYENLDGVRLHYGCFDLLEEACPAEGEGEGEGVGLNLENVIHVRKEEREAADGGPLLGSWLVAIRR